MAGSIKGDVKKSRVAQPLELNFRVADPSRLFEGSEGLVFPPPLDFPIGSGNVGAGDVGDGLGAAIAHHQF